MITANRYHDISVGHRVYGHESKCAHFHGHNYRIHFSIAPQAGAGLDGIGRVIDFSVIKSVLCEWLEQNWDHKFLIWEEDPHAIALQEMDRQGVVIFPLNPTAENMAWYLMDAIAPPLLRGLGVQLVECTIEETRKCSVTYKL